MDTERKPLLSNQQVIDEEEAWNGSIDGGAQGKLAATHTARWVRDTYEHMITEGKLRVVEEVEGDISIPGFVECKCKRVDVRRDTWELYNYCPGCGNKIKRA